MQMPNRIRDIEGYRPQAAPAALRVINGFKGESTMNKDGEAGVTVVRMEAKAFVGMAVTSSYQPVTGIGETSRQFMEHRGEIKGALHPDEYVCLHFANDIVFTYIYAIEVADLVEVPQGMIGLCVPGSRYAKARSRADNPYSLIDAYLKERGMEADAKLFAIEAFRFGEEESMYNADIYVPIRDAVHEAN